jgi:hypothetical protein
MASTVPRPYAPRECSFGGSESPRAARTPRTVASGVDPATTLEVDSTCLYWVDTDAGALTMAAK